MLNPCTSFPAPVQWIICISLFSGALTLSFAVTFWLSPLPIVHRLDVHPLFRDSMSTNHGLLVWSGGYGGG